LSVTMQMCNAPTHACQDSLLVPLLSACCCT